MNIMKNEKESTGCPKIMENIFKLFKERYGTDATVGVEIPGRVNIIGEHIDYCGYSVFPIAIQRTIKVAAKASPDYKTITIENTDIQHKPYITDRASTKVQIWLDPRACPATFWASYFMCGIRGVLDKSYPGEKEERLGMKVLIDGSIPQCAGLSSSSALVCAGVLLTSYFYGMDLPRIELANISAFAEQYVGTQGGGMDQTVILLAEAGKACYISFDPLNVEPVKLPDGICFVVAQSLVEKNKALSPDFNIRVAECQFASAVLWNRYKGTRADIGENCKRLAVVQSRLSLSLEEAISLVKENFHEEPYTKTELCELLGISSRYLYDHYLAENVYSVKWFKLRQRALHIFQEVLRVEEFVKLCKTGINNEECYKNLGTLMNHSHESLRDLYECSDPQLDVLVSICLEFGAYGARLTGAGWGGCVVAMVKKENVADFIASVKDKFYREKFSISDESKLDNLIFESVPSSGAVLYPMQKHDDIPENDTMPDDTCETSDDTSQEG